MFGSKGFLGLNPTAIGTLVGSVMGSAYGGGYLGAGIGALYDRAKGTLRDGLHQMQKSQASGIKNQNAIVEEGYNKRLGALGIGENPNPKKGNVSSQQGIALNANSEGVNLLG